MRWFRGCAPYINAHRNKTFVILFGGEAVADACFPHLVHDIALLHSLGVRLILVHGARPQIEQRLSACGLQSRYVKGVRITDARALQCAIDAACSARAAIEALLSMSVAQSPMAGARVRVAGSNFITARPVGVRAGTDYCYTGEVRRIDKEGMRFCLDAGAVVLISPLGYSPTGEIFNVSAEDVAAAVAIAMEADKLLCLVEGSGVYNAEQALVQQLTPTEAEQLMRSYAMPDGVARYLAAALRACRAGVRRSHLISRHTDGALLQELYTREGLGTLVTSENYEQTRTASIDDIGGILELITPLENDGILVRRSRERLEVEIGHFYIVERDGMIIACAALYPYAAESVGELACLAVHPDYRSGGRAALLLEYIERIAAKAGITRLFVLTTHTAHWFQEHGFDPAELPELPVERQRLYNYQRNSKVFIKRLED